ncbi:MAG: NACHT domain-containing protein [Chloroflexota bacterium]
MDPTLFEGLFAEILAPLVNGTLDGMSEEAKAQWAKVDPKKSAAAYKQMLEKRYGTIQILGQPRPQKLGKVYTDVYLHEKPTHTYAMQVKKLEEMFREQKNRFGRMERTNGLDFAKNHNRLFILGKPGAGKTTFLKYLTMQAARDDIPLIPIFVNLNDFQHQVIDLLDFIKQQFEACDFPNEDVFVIQLFKNGKGLILFDGLDEVSKEDNQRNQITRQIKKFITRYDKNHIAISCRIAASEYNFIGFDYVEMADFTDKQVRTFVERWFSESHQKIDGFLNELERSSNEGIKEMTTSPLLLTLLCIQYDGSMALPPSRSEIYEEALEVLLKTWDGHRDINRGDLIVEDEDRYKALTFKRKIQLMSRLAWGTFKEGKLFIEQKWMEDNIVKYLGKIPKGPDPDLVDGAVVLKAMESQHGLLVERASRIYSFSHLTLQEYFTAKYIVDHAQTDAALSSLVGSEKITDPRWREIFLFVAELLPNGDEFIMWFAESLQNLAGIERIKEILVWIDKKSIERPFGNTQLSSRLSYLTNIRFLAKSDSYQNLGKLSEIRNRTILRASRLAQLINILRRVPRDEDIHIINFVIREAVRFSKELSWSELSTSLESIHLIDKDFSYKEWESFLKLINDIVDKIIFSGWNWQGKNFHDVAILTQWLNGHELLFECLDRVMLDVMERREFEDNFMYKLPSDS